MLTNCTDKIKRPGFATMIISNGQTTEKEMQGLANLSQSEPISDYTNFRMASVSKQFTAACIILLKNEGLLNYSDSLSRFFPEFNFGNKITLGDILTHTSGILDYESMIPENRKEQVNDADVLNWVAKADSLYFEPGTQYRYSNSGFCILTQVIEKISGQPYAQFIDERIFKPLSMDNSYIYIKGSKMSDRALGYAKNEKDEIYENDQSITSATQGDGCVYTSLNDYQKWIGALQTNQLFNLKEELAEVSRPIKGLEGLKYGLGWFILNEELYHTGSTSGFSNVVWLSLDSQDAIVFFSNLADNHAGALDLFTKNGKIHPKVDIMAILKLTD